MFNFYTTCVVFFNQKGQIEMFSPHPILFSSQQATPNKELKSTFNVKKSPSLQSVFGYKTSLHPRDFKAYFYNQDTVQSVPMNLTISFIHGG